MNPVSIAVTWLVVLLIIILSLTLIRAHRETIALKKYIKRQGEMMDKIQQENEIMEIENIKILKESLSNAKDWEMRADVLNRALDAEMKKHLRYETMKKEYTELLKVNGKFIQFIQEKADKMYRDWLASYKDQSL